MSDQEHISINIDSNIDIPNIVENTTSQIKDEVNKVKSGIQNLTNSFIPGGLASSFMFKNNPMQNIDLLKQTVNEKVNEKVNDIKSESIHVTDELVSKLTKNNPNNVVDILAAIKQINSDLKDTKKPSFNQQTTQPLDTQDKPSDTQDNSSSLRNRKIDRRLLANDILAELPISVRFNDGVNIDNNETLENYVEDWKMFTEEGSNQLEILLEEIYIEEEKYKKLGKFNHNCARLIQFSLLILGSFIVYIQAAGSDASTIEKTTIVSGAGTTIATSLLTFFSFSKKAPHYSKISFTLKRLRCWLENKCMLPKIKAFSPYDLYTISKKSLDTILLEATEGLQETK